MTNIPSVGKRAKEEIMRVEDRHNISKRELARRMRIERKTIYAWGEFYTPRVNHLIKLGIQGADILYIITGKRSSRSFSMEEPEMVGQRAKEELKRLEQKFKISHSEITRRMGISRKTVYNWGKIGNPSTWNLVKLNAFGADVEYILTGRRHEENEEANRKTSDPRQTERGL